MQAASSSANFRWALLLLAYCFVALLWPPATPQETAGFLSIDCGLDSTANDPYEDGIAWVPDSDMRQQGTALPAVTGTTDQSTALSTMRLFKGNQSKYCYNLTSSAVKEGAFFLLRASFWAGIAPPYTPQNSDAGHLSFTLIVDGDVWKEDVKVSYGSTSPNIYEIYMRAQRDTIDVCLARSSPDGDAPFINALELRPLPPTLTSTLFMNKTGYILVLRERFDEGVLASVPSLIRYPEDLLDRLWVTSTEVDNARVTTTNATIDISHDRDDKPPAKIFQTANIGDLDVTWTFTDLDPNGKYFVVFYFAEIDPYVNASGLRVFNIHANGVGIFSDDQQDIDVFAAVGANAAVAYSPNQLLSPDATGGLAFTLASTPASIYPAFIAAKEIFSAKLYTPLSSPTIVSAVEKIKTSLGLSSYKGDPCLPAGFQYNWLRCSGAIITSLSLSNYHTGGTISNAISNLTSLTEIYMDENNLQGEIPDLSALANLQVLDLSNNVLHGHISGFLATLKNLKVLNVQNNNLSGEIPIELLQQMQASTLNFKFSGNPLLYCGSNDGVPCSFGNTPSISPSNKERNFGIILWIAVFGIVVAGLVTIINIYCICHRKKHMPLDNVELLAKRSQTPGTNS